MSVKITSLRAITGLFLCVHATCASFAAPVKLHMQQAKLDTLLEPKILQGRLEVMSTAKSGDKLSLNLMQARVYAKLAFAKYNSERTLERQTLLEGWLSAHSDAPNKITNITQKTFAETVQSFGL